MLITTLNFQLFTLNDKRGYDMGVVKNYDQLRVYQLAFQSAMRIIRAFDKMAEPREIFFDRPNSEILSVCLRQHSRVVAKRRYPAHFASKVSDADAEAAEIDVWLNFALECGYLSLEDCEALHDSYDNVCRKLSLMISDSESWCKNQRSS